MARLLIWMLLIGVVWWMWRSHQRVPPPRRTPPAEAPRTLTMLRCAHCGVHLPAADTVTDREGQAYCGPAHRALGPASPPR
jgi:uncharacterized protein